MIEINAQHGQKKSHIIEETAKKLGLSVVELKIELTEEQKTLFNSDSADSEESYDGY